MMIKWIKWRIKGKPMIEYIGYHCGLCGRWIDEPFTIPEYRSYGKWCDTWGMCKKCERGERQTHLIIENRVFLTVKVSEREKEHLKSLREWEKSSKRKNIKEKI